MTLVPQQGLLMQSQQGAAPIGRVSTPAGAVGGGGIMANAVGIYARDARGCTTGHYTMTTGDRRLGANSPHPAELGLPERARQRRRESRGPLRTAAPYGRAHPV